MGRTGACGSYLAGTSPRDMWVKGEYTNCLPWSTAVVHLFAPLENKTIVEPLMKDHPNDGFRRQLSLFNGSC